MVGSVAALAATPAAEVRVMILDLSENMQPEVSGWGVYCYEFLLLPNTSYYSSSLLLVFRPSKHT